MRRIDGDKLQKSLENVLRIQRDLGANELELSMLQWAIDIVRNQPNIAPPPNDPLTLEELREMDGEPVWVVTGSDINAGRGCWDICDWWDKNTVMFPYSGEQPKIDAYGITWFAYRRKPEEDQNDT